MTAQLDSERAGLLRDVLEQPFDDGARLVFADHCEDGGEAGRAGLIRVQVEIAQWKPTEHCLYNTRPHYNHRVGQPCVTHRQGGNCQCRLHSLRAQESLLLKEPWGALEPRPAGAFVWRDGDRLGWGWKNSGEGSRDAEVAISRGFVTTISLPLAEFTEANARAIFSAHPATRVVLTCREPTRVNVGKPLTWWREAGAGEEPGELPARLFDRLSASPEVDPVPGSDEPTDLHCHYGTAEDALADLSRACVAWGRGLAGLPPLTWPEEGQP